jgi:small GTP-binding protein
VRGIMARTKVDANKKVRVAFLGDSGVGKTSLLKRLKGENYCDNQEPTQGMSQSLDNNNGIEYYDFSGQERFKSSNKKMHKNNDICIICIDGTAPKEEVKVKEQITEYIRTTDGRNRDVQFIIAITKLDDEKKITKADIQNELKKADIQTEIPIIETSAQENTGIDDLQSKITEFVGNKITKENHPLLKEKEFLQKYIIENPQATIIKHEGKCFLRYPSTKPGEWRIDVTSDPDDKSKTKRGGEGAFTKGEGTWKIDINNRWVFVEKTGQMGAKFNNRSSDNSKDLSTQKNGKKENEFVRSNIPSLNMKPIITDNTGAQASRMALAKGESLFDIIKKEASLKPKEASLARLNANK